MTTTSIITFDTVAYSAKVADTADTKVAGLEIVESLQENEGMLFPFNNTHVTFHMGKVQYPIDILFVKKTSNKYVVSKIIHNAQPGCQEMWSNSNVDAVLEISGGQCRKYGISIGSKCKINTILTVSQEDENGQIS